MIYYRYNNIIKICDPHYESYYKQIASETEDVMHQNAQAAVDQYYQQPG